MSESLSTTCTPPALPADIASTEPAVDMRSGRTPEARRDEPVVTPSPKPIPRGVWWALGVIIVVGALLRAYRLGNGGLWYDELIMARITAGTWAALGSEVMLGRPPIYPVVGKLWATIFGYSDTALRALSAVLGVISLPFMFAVARRLFDWRVGLLATLLLAVSPYQIYYSQEHRYYALFLVLCLASIGLLLRALRWGEPRADLTQHQAKPTRPRWVSWAGHVAVSALAFYTHSFALFLLSSIGLAVLIRYRRGGMSLTQMKRFLVSQVAIMVLLVPWGLLKFGQVQMAEARGTGQGEALVVPWITSPPWWAPVRTVGNFMFLGVKYLSLPWVVAGVVLLLAGVGFAVWRRGGLRSWSATLREKIEISWKTRRASWWMAAAWTLGPLLMVLGLSYTVRPIYNDRYLMASTPGLYLLVAASIVALARVLPAWSSLGVILLGMAGALGTYYEQPDKGAWAEAAAWLDANRAEGEALAFSSERDIGRENANVRANWFWYAQNGRDEPHLEVQVRSDFAATINELKSVSEPYAGVWLVMWRDPDESLGLGEVFARGQIEGLTLAEEKRFFDLTLLRLERTDASAGLADSENGPPLPAALETQTKPGLPPENRDQ